MVTQARKLGRQCKRCQKFKKRTKKYGHLEPKQAETLVPWHTVCVDLIGTYSLTAKVRQPDGTIKNCELKLLCMTFIDPATGWFEIAQMPNKRADDHACNRQTSKRRKSSRNSPN